MIHGCIHDVLCAVRGADSACREAHQGRGGLHQGRAYPVSMIRVISVAQIDE